MKSEKGEPKKSGAWEFFDDCPICQAMKEGKASTEKELLEAFRKAEEKNRRK